jgi:hypothetical protein
VSKELGIVEEDHVDKHSVSRITFEVKLASDIQLVSEIHNAGGQFSVFISFSNFKS